jgi:hypothetical protein
MTRILMKLIIEKYKNELFAFFEDENSFKKNEIQRKDLRINKIENHILKEECNLESLKDNVYLVFKLHTLFDFKK